MRISAVIITFNEEQNISRCLESLHEVADEIIVVDSNSTDRTPEICKTFDVKFFSHAFEGYIEQKNYANSLASCEYILSIDADEVLSNELKSSILDVKQHPEFEAYQLARKSSFCGQWINHCSWYPDKKMRLWKKESGKWGGENLHEHVVLNTGCKVSLLKGDLLHYTFHTIEQHIETINKFSTIAAESRFKKGKKTTIFRILFKPLSKFITMYFFRKGVLDGYLGYVICRNSAFSAYLKEIKLKQLHKTNR